MTFLQVVNIIRDTALAQPNVNTFVRNFLDLNREDTVYSAVVLQDRDGLRDRISEQDWNTYTFHLGYVDRLTYDESNRDDIFSTGINIINNIVASIRDTWFPDVEVNIIDRFQTFDQRFTASCAGVYVVLAIQVPISECVDGEQTDIYDKFEVKITENGDYHFVPDGRPIDEVDITVDVSGGGEKPEESLVETITSNGSYHYDPSAGSVFSSVAINVNCPGPKPDYRGIWTFDTNGSGTLNPMDGYVFNAVDYVVDVHPSQSLVETITSNGSYSYPGEYAGADITVSVPVPSISSLITTPAIENGVQRFAAGEGEAWNFVEIPIDVHPSTSLVESITSNGSYHYTGEWKDADITVAVSAAKPEESLVETITSNGSYSFSPTAGYVFSDASIVVDVHPSNRLVETITSNGSYSYPGEYAGADITVTVSAAKPEESLVETISSNGSYSFSPTAGYVFSDASIAVDVHPSDVLSRSYTTNGTKTITGEFNGGTINISVHPSTSLSRTYTSNGSYNISGEFNGGVVTVAVTTTVTVTMTQAQYNALSVKDPNTIYLIKG